MTSTRQPTMRSRRLSALLRLAVGVFLVSAVLLLLVGCTSAAETTATTKKTSKTIRTTKRVVRKTTKSIRRTVAATHRIDLRCKSGTYTFGPKHLAAFEDQVNKNTEFLGTWNGLGRNIIQNPDNSVELKLLRPPTRYPGSNRFQGAGAVITHRRRLAYGKVSAVVRAGPRNAGGVVMSFITMSPRGDEIDFEWVLGSAATPNSVQYTWYRGQIPNTVPNFWGRGGSCGPARGGNLRTQFNTYSFEWRRSFIQWELNGVPCLRINRNDWWGTYPNGTRYLMFPDEPANIQFGIWDGGGPAVASGTNDWAGGPTRWTSDALTNGFGITIANLTVRCGPA